jgi:hypothetical protein
MNCIPLLPSRHLLKVGFPSDPAFSFFGFSFFCPPEYKDMTNDNSHKWKKKSKNSTNKGKEYV